MSGQVVRVSSLLSCRVHMVVQSLVAQRSDDRVDAVEWSIKLWGELGAHGAREREDGAVAEEEVRRSDVFDGEELLNFSYEAIHAAAHGLAYALGYTSGRDSDLGTRQLAPRRLERARRPLQRVDVSLESEGVGSRGDVGSQRRVAPGHRPTPVTVAASTRSASGGPATVSSGRVSRPLRNCEPSATRR